MPQTHIQHASILAPRAPLLCVWAHVYTSDIEPVECGGFECALVDYGEEPGHRMGEKRMIYICSGGAGSLPRAGAAARRRVQASPDNMLISNY